MREEVHLRVIEGQTVSGLRLVAEDVHGPAGRVVDALGRPVPEAQVSASWVALWVQLGHHRRARPVRLERHRAARCQLTAEAPGHALGVLDRVPAGALDVVIALGRAGAIRGCVAHLRVSQ
jgi:hypothetical protein